MSSKISVLALSALAWVLETGCVSFNQHSSEPGAESSSELKWPAIGDFFAKVHFDVTKQRKFERTIFSSTGLPLYVLDARIPSDKDPEGDYDYSGAFDCRLYSVKRGDGVYPTLLQNARNATRDWETDGRFLSSELTELAGTNLSRVILQRSRLRGMAIEIEIGHVVVDAKTGYIQSFDASFSFRNDPTALSDIATEPTK